MKPAAIIFAALMLASSVATADEKEVPPGPAPAKRYTGGTSRIRSHAC